MPDDTLKNLEMRITKIETLLEKALERQTPSNLTADELATYRKVRDVIAADYGDFCGINDCFRCNIFRCGGGPSLCRPVVCDIECSCGPCNIGPIGGGLRRFSGLGD